MFTVALKKCPKFFINRTVYRMVLKADTDLMCLSYICRGFYKMWAHMKNAQSPFVTTWEQLAEIPAVRRVDFTSMSP